MAKMEFAKVEIRPAADGLMFAIADGKALGTVETDADGKLFIRPYPHCFKAAPNG